MSGSHLWPLSTPAGGPYEREIEIRNKCQVRFSRESYEWVYLYCPPPPPPDRTLWNALGIGYWWWGLASFIGQCAVMQRWAINKVIASRSTGWVNFKLNMQASCEISRRRIRLFWENKETIFLFALSPEPCPKTNFSTMTDWGISGIKCWRSNRN